MTRRPLLLIVLVIVTSLSTLVGAVAPAPGDAARRDHRKAARSDNGEVGAEVFGGQAVPDGRYPFVTAVGVANASGGLKKQFCGGSLIGPSSVLTAAHCVRGIRSGVLAVVVGQSEFGTAQGETRTVTDVIVHPGFNSRTLVNDVAVLRLNLPILSVTPVGLIGAGNESFNFGGTQLTLVGWGDTTGARAKVKFPQRLRERSVSVVGDGHCSKKWRKVGFKKGIDGAHTLCTAAGKFGLGDSGSPVFSQAGGFPVQVSLVSAGFAGAQRKVPDLGPQLSEPGIAGFIASVNA